MKTQTMSDAMQIMDHSYRYATNQGGSDHNTALDYATWVCEHFPDGDCDHSIHFWITFNRTTTPNAQ